MRAGVLLAPGRMAFERTQKCATSFDIREDPESYRQTQLSPNSNLTEAMI